MYSLPQKVVRHGCQPRRHLIGDAEMLQNPKQSWLFDQACSKFDSSRTRNLCSKDRVEHELLLGRKSHVKNMRGNRRYTYLIIDYIKAYNTWTHHSISHLINSDPSSSSSSSSYPLSLATGSVFGPRIDPRTWNESPRTIVSSKRDDDIIFIFLYFAFANLKKIHVMMQM